MYDVGIIGSGPAGIAAGIYLKRAGFKIILFEKNRIGGLLQNAHLVENYPGFPDGISGVKLCEFMKKHLEKWKIKPIFEKIIKISFEKKNFILKSTNKDYQVKSVIIATGTKPKKIDIPGEINLLGNKIFYEIKDIIKVIKPSDKCVIIGGGDAGFDYALNLSEKDILVEIFFKSESPKCLPLLESRVRNDKNILLNPSMIPKEFIIKNGKIETIFALNKYNNYKPALIEKKIPIISDFILIACGRIPEDEISMSPIEKSNIDGFYFAGDVRTGKFRQVGIAIGEGIAAAMKAELYLRGEKK